MKTIDLNLNWSLQQGEPSRIPGMPKQIREVNLLNDFIIKANVRTNSKTAQTLVITAAATTAPRRFPTERSRYSFRPTSPLWPAPSSALRM